MFFVLKITEFESRTTNSHNPEQNTCHWQSMCYEKTLRFNRSLKEIFPNSSSLRVMRKYDEMCFHADFTRVWDHLTCGLWKGVLKRCFLESGLTKSLTVFNFRNKVAMTIIFFFFWKCLKFDVDSRKGLKEREKNFGFSDNCIWIGEEKFSQSRTGYMSSQSVRYETPLRLNIFCFKDNCI